MYELEKQVGPLEKQSETARIYLKHRDTLKQYDANMYLLSFYQLKKDSAAIDEKMDIVSTHALIPSRYHIPLPTDGLNYPE